LAQLAWAKDIVVVDSGSTDGTVDILRSNPKIRLFRRTFDTHHAQWRYAMSETAIGTPWVLRLDADYQVPPELTAEMARLTPPGNLAAYEAAFDYAVFGRRLASSLYPPKPVLLRLGSFSISDEGHTEGWIINGPVAKLRARLIHDDWKSMRDWATAQARYMTRERQKLESRRAGLRDWLRMHPPLMPLTVFFYCLFGKGLLFNGKAGLLYTLQRTIAEGILCLYILENKLAPSKKTNSNEQP
jgi:glycosyltransferase involved in cell wall biosynthesis